MSDENINRDSQQLCTVLHQAAYHALHGWHVALGAGGSAGPPVERVAVALGNRQPHAHVTSMDLAGAESGWEKNNVELQGSSNISVAAAAERPSIAGAYAVLVLDGSLLLD